VINAFIQDITIIRCNSRYLPDGNFSSTDLKLPINSSPMIVCDEKSRL
jgi:hypothetical protein